MEALFSILIPFIIMIESSGNPNPPPGKANDVGIVQITPIYLRECNRILGYDKYVLEDRKDHAKSIEMLKIHCGYWGKRSGLMNKGTTLDKLLVLGAIHHGGARGHLKNKDNAHIYSQRVIKDMDDYKRKIIKLYKKGQNNASTK